MYIKTQYINEFFFMLNQTTIRYVLIKNISDELPEHLVNGKDIDILVHPEDRCVFDQVMQENHFIQVIHPLGVRCGWKFGYQLEESEFWKRTDIADNLYIDVNFKLCCKSLMGKIWIPLDQTINHDVWNDRTFNHGKQWWQMDDSTTLIYLIVRAVFDKQKFSPVYVMEIERRIEMLKDPQVVEKLSKVCFKFTSTLIDMLQSGAYDTIVQEYITFTDY